MTRFVMFGVCAAAFVVSLTATIHAHRGVGCTTTACLTTPAGPKLVN